MGCARIPNCFRRTIDSVVDPTKPAIPPRHHLWHEVDPRAGRGSGRVRMCPRTCQQAARHIVLRQLLHHPEGVVAVSVCPASNDHRRNVDAVVPRTYRPLPPIGTVTRMLTPRQKPWLVLFEPSSPFFTPRGPEYRWSWRQDVVRRHVVRIVDEVDPLQEPAHVMNIIGVTIIGCVDRDHCLEMRWTFTRHLE